MQANFSASPFQPFSTSKPWCNLRFFPIRFHATSLDFDPISLLPSFMPPSHGIYIHKQSTTQRLINVSQMVIGRAVDRTDLMQSTNLVHFFSVSQSTKTFLIPCGEKRRDDPGGRLPTSRYWSASPGCSPLRSKAE